MSPFTVVAILSIFTVVGQVALLAVAAALLTGRPRVIRRWLSGRETLLMLIVAAAATAGSLYFSEVAGWTPCRLCWFQRIFMYPQVILLGIAAWKKDRGIAMYILPLCVIGGAIAAAHYTEQVWAALHPVLLDASKPCDSSGVSCAKTPFFHFGYITIPMMALTAFMLNALGSVSMLLSRATRSS